jgi:type VI secretion system FHA domain protein
VPFQVDPAWMEHLGALVRASTEGTLALLRSRRVAKRSIRAESTQIVARQNNPLKFAPDAAQALVLLLSLQSRRGFLDPVDAVRDAHNDLQVHQLAMVAGMRAAVFELISRLGPEVTEAAEGPAHGLAQSIPALRDAALWRRHRQDHERMLENLDDVFEVAFGREFLKAYEAQSKLGAPALPPLDVE